MIEWTLIRHRLALGVIPIDALSETRLIRLIEVAIELDEGRVLDPLLAHASGRYVALDPERYDESVVLRLHDRRRSWVPRRLAVPLPPDDDTSVALRAREPVLYPGVNWHLSGGATALRGWVQRDAEPVRWAWLEAREPGDERVAMRTRADDRGAIANATDDPGFVKEATTKLFPPRALDTSIEVRGVPDWVLFHARHRKQCSAEPGPAPRPRPARYRVYTRAVANANELGVLIEQLQQDGELLGQFQFTELGAVEFEPGVATLADSVEEIEQLWPHGDERELAWAGVAVTTAGAEQLARARLLALEELIEDQSPASDGQLSRVLEQVPAVFEPGDAEGVIVLLTLPQRPALRVSLYFAARAVLQQLLEPDVPEGEGIDWLLETFAEAMTHVGELELVDGEITNFEPDQDVSLVEPNHLIGYRHEADQTSPEGRELAAVARRVFEFVGLETSDVPFTEVELERWSNERGDVVLVGVGIVDTGEVPLI